MKKVILSVILIIITGVSNFAQSFDHSGFEKLLKENVNEKGLINYKGFAESKEFDEYLKQLATAKISEFDKNEKLSFLINAYNALVIKNVIDHPGIKSPMQVRGFFDDIKFEIFGEELTLNDLEYDYVIKIEPVLTHFGLVCAAVSCPKLLRETYKPGKVYEQLESNARDFLNNKYKNRLDSENKTLYLSEIFKWFEKYFTGNYGSVINFVKKYINEKDKKFLEENEVDIEFIRYNWALNKQKEK